MNIMQGTLTFHKDGSALTECPIFFLAASYSYDKLANTTIQPNIYLYCNGTLFDIVSVIWKATDKLSKKEIPNLFSPVPNSLLSIMLVTNNTAV